MTRKPKPSPAALRLCHAVGLATRCQVGRWVSIGAALELLPATDQGADAEPLLEAAVASDLTKLSGPVETAHSIALTAAGLDACHAAGGAGAPQNGRSASKVQPQRPRRR